MDTCHKTELPSNHLVTWIRVKGEWEVRGLTALAPIEPLMPLYAHTHTHTNIKQYEAAQYRLSEGKKIRLDKVYFIVPQRKIVLDSKWLLWYPKCMNRKKVQKHNTYPCIFYAIQTLVVNAAPWPLLRNTLESHLGIFKKTFHTELLQYTTWLYKKSQWFLTRRDEKRRLTADLSCK